MIEKEWLHAPPMAGQVALPCCGRTLEQLPRYDRIIRDPDKVTCGRLSDSEMTLLSGQPVITDPEHERVVFAMVGTVCALSSGLVSLNSALDSVNAAVQEVVPRGQALTRWSAPLMVQVTARAQQLAASA